MEISVENGEGDDIAIYAKRSEGGIQVADQMHYLVLLKQEEDWLCIGLGGGILCPESFDLGDIQKIDMVRIMYRNQFDFNLTSIIIAVVMCRAL